MLGRDALGFTVVDDGVVSGVVGGMVGADGFDMAGPVGPEDTVVFDKRLGGLIIGTLLIDTLLIGILLDALIPPPFIAAFIAFTVTFLGEFFGGARLADGLFSWSNDAAGRS